MVTVPVTGGRGHNWAGESPAGPEHDVVGGPARDHDPQVSSASHGSDSVTGRVGPGGP